MSYSKRQKLLAKEPSIFVWKHPQWPDFTVDAEALRPDQAQAAVARAEALAQLQAVGLALGLPLTHEALAQEALATAAIEGQRLDVASVRSSVLRKLGLASEQTPALRPGRAVDGLIDVLRNAVAVPQAPLDDERLCLWQAALFQGDTPNIRRIATGRYRDHADAMQIVSGLPGREVVHYQAPPSAQVPKEMRRFIQWFNRTAPQPGKAPKLDGLTRAAIAHLWFESIHPFEDGNGRIGRALIDRAIAQDTYAQGGDPSVRLMGISRELERQRGAYYDALNAAQRPSAAAAQSNAACDATGWVLWFTQAFTAACTQARSGILQAQAKANFWATHLHADLNPRQRKALQRLLDAGDGGFLGGMNADKYSQLTGASKATATRDLTALLGAGQLWSQGQGKATRYFVNVPGWTHVT